MSIFVSPDERRSQNSQSDTWLDKQGNQDGRGFPGIASSVGMLTNLATQAHRCRTSMFLVEEKVTEKRDGSRLKPTA
jgi:hypothetical protein